MNVKQWLMRARTIDAEIADLDEQIKKELAKKREIYDILTSATQSFAGDVVQSTKDPHKFDKIAEFETAVDNLIDKYVDKRIQLANIKAEIVSAISRLSDGRYREVLEKYYVQGMTLEMIAVNMHYSWRHVCTLHGRALLKMEGIINGLS